MTTLARKYRPTRLRDLLGQDALRTSLSAAFAHDRIPQAILLTGVRGVGKTTTARIIARSVNCEQGPTEDPCGACTSCREIAGDNSLDVIEMDAASQTGVEAMRDLIENVSYAPMRAGARKIYILDEAHMLSTPAWNALLKTLEEPPEHVVFIFATTEADKIPATIHSRCQSLVLRRISTEIISGHVQDVAAREGVDLEAGVAETIARAGGGSMRDALSILDQAIASAGQPGTRPRVGLDATRAMLGQASTGRLVGLLADVASGKPERLMPSWRGLIEDGADPLALVDDLSRLIHLSQVAACARAHLDPMGLGAEDISVLEKIGTHVGLDTLGAAQAMIFAARRAIRENPDRSLAAEIFVMRLNHHFSAAHRARTAA